MNQLFDEVSHLPAMEDQHLRAIKTRTTVDLSEDCIILFNEFSDHQPQWSEDQLARFKIWIANLGVFENGHASVDYRLRDHPIVLNLVIQQLEVLKINLEKVKSLVSEPVQSQLQRRATSKSECFDIDGEDFVYDSPSSECSFSSSNSELDEPGHLNHKVLESLQVVEDTIARLNALSTAIRRSGKRSRTSKADSYEVIEYIDGERVNATQQFQTYAEAIVNREIPATEQFLRDRVTVSIARRRNRFLYWKRHDKTSNIYVKKVMPMGLVKELGAPQQENRSQAEKSIIRSQNRPSAGKTIMTGFTATTFDASNFRKPTASAMGSVRPTGSVRFKNREEFPKPPKVGFRESHFICPICLILSPAKEAKGDLWIQHVTRDLKPYICVFEGCKTPQAPYESFQEWTTHMKKEHMAPEWHCASASHPLVKFNSQGLFESHMRERHPKGFNEAQLPALANRSMRFGSEIFNSCPFCSYSQEEDDMTHCSPSRLQDELQYHISSHLLSLAFISLPPLDAGDDSESESYDDSRVLSDSRIDPTEAMEILRFDDITHYDGQLEGDMAPAGDSSWDYVWQWKTAGSPPKENSPDRVLERLRKVQLEMTPTLVVTSSGEYSEAQERGSGKNVPRAADEDHQKEDMNQESMKNPEIGTAIQSTAENAASVIDRDERHDEEVQRQTVEDRQNLLGPQHPETLTSINNLARTLFFHGKYKEAEPLYRQALAGRQKTLGQEHLDTIKSLNDLAQNLVYLGQFKAGEELYRQALAAGEKTLGIEHPYVLQNIHNLGGALRNQGRHEEAMGKYQQALAGRTKVLGELHPDTLTSINNLGGAFERMGKYRDAELQYRVALDGREKVLGAEHFDTLQSLHSFASALRHQGFYKNAETLYRQALAGRQKTLGRTHPNTLKSLNNLGLTLERQEKYAEAEEMYRQALAVREEVLGKEHFDIYQSINNIGSARFHQSDYTEAESLYRQALEGRKRVFGPEHPDTLQSIHNLATALEKLDRVREAIALCYQAYEGREKLLGKDHPDTQQSHEVLNRLKLSSSILISRYGA
ncbi:hypothetical protein B0J14DRAFT_99997 [Halenospora varia]|nr:hypothetical protein B0J14DRAFT_99997 [Halenospora varia]